MHHKVYKKVVLVIFDGFGVAPAARGNAIAQAKTPTLDYLVANFPSLTLQASGPLVGLPWGEMGNSEVGHLNLGAGRIVGQDLPRITSSIQSGDFFKNPALLGAINHAIKNHSSLHLLGMVSPGGVHSLDEHLYALLAMAAEKGLQKIFVHMFTDGRDTEPKIALQTLAKLNQKIGEAGGGHIATITGRFYAMDRGQHWNQTMQTYHALVDGVGEIAHNAEEAVRKSYQAQIFDEMIKPAVVVDEDNHPVTKIVDNDAIIFFNFRSDRALQLSRAFVQPEAVPEELRPKRLQNIYFTSMTQYAPDLPCQVAFAPVSMDNNLAQVLAHYKYTQFHIAESEKYAHVTAFFNCGKTDTYPGEERLIVTSPENNAHNYVDNPEMSAVKLTEILTQKISAGNINFFVANYANSDMVGHTGNLAAATLAVESLDRCLKKVAQACLLADAALLVTADHGNVEQMINLKTGDIDKDHTTNPVPLLVVANELKFPRPLDKTFLTLSGRIPSGAISDVAPTILELLNLPKPKEMTGISLLDSIDEIPKHPSPI